MALLIRNGVKVWLVDDSGTTVCYKQKWVKKDSAVIANIECDKKDYDQTTVCIV